MPDPTSTSRSGAPAHRAPASSLVRAFLRVPLFYKILAANAVIVVLGAVGGTAITREIFRSSSTRLSEPAVAALLALSGLAVTLLVNALLLRLALTPLKLLEQTADRVQTGDLEARVPHSALADREMERLTTTFNAMLDTQEAYRQRLREVAARALNAEEEERKRISRELHDDTAQTLAALLLQLRVARSTDDPETRDRLLEAFRAEVADALERIRRFARGLRPPALEELGLVPALESHARSISESSGVAVRVEAAVLDGLLTRQAELALYRIAQEALSNAVRHSGAGAVRIGIHRRGDQVVLTVEDDGRGFNPQRVQADEGQGLGLFGMEERAAYVGGQLEIRSDEGVGTQVRATVPLAGIPGPR